MADERGPGGSRILSKNDVDGLTQGKASPRPRPTPKTEPEPVYPNPIGRTKGELGWGGGALTRVQDLIDEKLDTRRHRGKVGRGLAVLRKPERDGIHRPPFDSKRLIMMPDVEPMVGAAGRAIITQVSKRGVELEPLYAVKCTACETEYDREIRVCTTPECPGTKDPKLLGKPPEEELKNIEVFMRFPNPLNQWGDMIRKTLHFEVFLDGTHWEVVRAKKKQEGSNVELTHVKEMWVLPSSRVHPVIDPRTGLPGKPDERFCPACIRKDPKLAESSLGKDRLECGTCEGPTFATAWVMEAPDLDDNTVVMRYAREEILHYNTWAVDDSLEGNPVTLALLDTAQLLVWRRRYQRKLYSTGESPSNIIAFPEMDQPAVDKMYDSVVESIDSLGNPMLDVDVWLGVREAPTVVNLMPSMRELQSVQEYDRLVQEVAADMGVTEEALGKSTPGQLGHPEEKLTIMLDTMEGYAAQLEEFLNGQVLPLFPEVKSWRFIVRLPDMRDELAEENLRSARTNRMLQLLDRGFDVHLTDTTEMHFETSDRPVRPTPRSPDDGPGEPPEIVPPVKKPPRIPGA